MAMTTLGDLFAETPTAAYDVVQSYMDADPVTQTPFFESGLLTTNPIVQQLAAAPSDILTLPYWQDIDASVEPNYSNDVYEDIAVPRKIGTGSMQARNAHLNEGFGSMSLVAEVTNKDPLQRIASRLDGYWRKEAELRVVASLKGIFADNDTNDADDMIHVTGATATYADIVDLHATMGDAFGQIAGYVMHSTDYFALVKEGMASEPTRPEVGRLTGQLNGLPVIVNDTATTVMYGATPTAHRLTVALGAGAFAYGMALPPMNLEYEREPARGNGGGADTLWTRRNMIVHPLGFTFTSTSITGNGTETVARGAGWTDLQNAVNWDRVADRKQIPLAFMVTPV